MLYSLEETNEAKQTKKAEKLTGKIIKVNTKWNIDDTIKLLKTFKLTKKRK